ncbi:MAG: HD domain-containing protein [Deltaproteobacteria bacterium]|nr:HD domain-containing protein [Deltaproteobacteria bacterium]
MDIRTAVTRLTLWFEEYVRQFASSDLRVQENMDLKAGHTRRVCSVILDIGASLNLPIEDLCTAEAAGLLHDIGRFEQYKQYGTFVDHRSEDHAALGVKVIQKTRVLEQLGAFDSEIIMQVVGAHNRAGLPAGADERVLFFLQIVRDADKIDIWRVVTSYYRNAARQRNHALELDLPDRPYISEPVYEALMKGRLVKMKDLKTLNDFKLLQMAWVYDLNFPRAFQIVRDNGYLEWIRDAISFESSRIMNVYMRARSHLDRHCPDKKPFHNG